ncbi:hypothetical protein JKP88DRAFT_179296, partial [Tribonema minus]
LCKNSNLRPGRGKRLIMGISRIHGWGAFAGEDIERGEFVSEYKGEVISQDEAERRGQKYDMTARSFLFNLNEDEVLDATRMGNKMKFANNQDPVLSNLRVRVVLKDGEHRICMFAKRHIAMHEELSFHYGYSQEHQRYISVGGEGGDERGEKKGKRGRDHGPASTAASAAKKRHKT